MRLPRHTSTAHIQANRALCESCGRCVETCPHGVLGLVPLPFHHHVHVDHADRCRGCLRCVRACVPGAIQPVRPPAKASPAAAGDRSPA